VDATDATKFTVTRLSDNTKVTADPAGVYDGVTLSLGSSPTEPAAGDSFLIQPTKTGARDLAVVLTDPAKMAAASPVITGSAPANRGSGTISAATVESGYPATSLTATVSLKYDSLNNKLSGFPDSITRVYTSGQPISFGSLSVTISGQLSNNDTFTIARNTSGVSDGSNALLMGALQNKKTIGNGSASFSDAYSQLVSTVGNKTRQLQIANTAQTSLTAQIRSAQQSVSGVNQDEETANLLMFQQMYQANAKVIQTASTLFDAVLGIR
jgi:flagellar hook-associated protein 1 FlgK